MATITGSNASDFELVGTDLADQIFGLGGNDILIGVGGDDVLEGGAGADQLFGSPGFDHASYRNSSAGMRIHLDVGITSGGDAAGDGLYSIGGLIGSAYGDQFVGTDERNMLRGEGGSDHISGLGGNDLLVGGGGDDVLHGSSGADELRGGAGIDIALYDGPPLAMRIDLAGGRSFGGEAEGDRLSGIEGVLGNAMNDRISGNAAANLLAGYGGADTMTGGGGADRFFYLGADSSATRPDRITDFSRSQGDKIDFRDMDANEQMSGNQAFNFISQGPFTGAGQVRYHHQNGDTIIEADTNTTISGAESVIVLDGLISLRASDFIL